MSLIIENNYLKVTTKTAGAELTSVYSKTRDKELLWDANPEFWSRHAPVLFPIVGKLKDNVYRVDAKEYSLPQHGFARDMEFELSSQTKNKISFVLKSDATTLLKYPYLFELIVSYELKENELKTTFSVANNGQKPMIFSIGAHPAYVCPLYENETLSDYYLELDQQETLERHLLTDGLFDNSTELVVNNSKTITLSDALFDKDAVVFKNIKSQKMTLKSKTSDYQLQFEFNNFPHFGIWSKRDSGFICLEPWCGYSDSVEASGDIETKTAIETLLPNDVFERSYSAYFN